jgi:pimeloyl-ACP methyl ester carboxylesterase
MGAVRPFRQAGEMWYLQDSTVEELVIRHDGVSLAATYSPARDVALVALHGAGAGTRDYFLYRHLHNLLPEVGIGVVTFDRRGEGQSTGDGSRGRFEVQARDALAVRDAIDARRVGLWGVSQGGWIAPLAASESDRIAFVVGIASTGVTPSEQMMYAVAQQFERAGYGQAAVRRVLALRRFYEDYVHGRAPGREAELAAELAAAMDEPWWLLAFLPPVPLDAEGCRLWIEEMDFDPRAIFARVRVPALMFYGEDDAWTPVEPSVRAWREARGDQVEIVVIPEASHELCLADDSIAPEYEDKLADWLCGLRL